MKAKKWYIKRYNWIIIGIISIVVVPLIINVLFKLNSPFDIFVAEWNAGDALGFYGTILGAGATIIAVIMTINFNKSLQREERILAIKPWLHTDYHPKFSDHFLINHQPNLSFMNIDPDEDSIPISYEAPSWLFEDSKNISSESNNLRIKQNYYLIIYETSNVGAGNAINIKLTINGIVTDKPFAIAINNTKTICMIFDLNKLNSTEEYEVKIRFEYSDVASLVNYYQEEEIIIFRNENSSLTSKQSNTISAPKELDG